MPAESPIADVTHVIQLSVAPVFLLTAIGTILNVLSARLSRVVDRYRVVQGRLETASGAAGAPLRDELLLLLRRRRLVQLAITSGTLSALLVSTVIGTAFVGFVAQWRVAGTIAGLFIAAMAFFVAALVLFLREVLLAVASPLQERR
ncbi:MAG TPA: DUF2721 domain-containing protein [Anaeromyxobacteraceae bacterium]|jgi:hypothetical protein